MAPVAVRLRWFMDLEAASSSVGAPTVATRSSQAGELTLHILHRYRAPEREVDEGIPLLNGVNAT